MDNDSIGKHIAIGTKAVIAFLVVEVLQFTASAWALFVGGGTIQETLRQKGVGLKVLFVLSALQFLVAIGLAIYFWSIRRRQSLHQWKSKMNLIHGRHFTNEAVPIDGMHFRECVFMSVNLVYNGSGAFHLENCQFKSGTRFSSSTPSIMSAMVLAHQLFNMEGGKLKTFAVDDLGRDHPIPITIHTPPHESTS